MTGLEASGLLCGVGVLFLFIGLMAKIESDLWGNIFLGFGAICFLPLFLRLWLYVLAG